MTVKEYMMEPLPERPKPDLSKNPVLVKHKALAEIEYREKQYHYLLDVVQNYIDMDQLRKDALAALEIVQWREEKAMTPHEEGWGWQNHPATRDRFLRFYYTVPALLNHAAELLSRYGDVTGLEEYVLRNEGE